HSDYPVAYVIDFNLFYILVITLPLSSTLFPYTTLFRSSPVTMNIIATIGVCTAFIAAFIALTQNDIKKVLAYSTVSQLGYMFLRSEEHTSELQSRFDLVCRLLLEKKKKAIIKIIQVIVY